MIVTRGLGAKSFLVAGGLGILLSVIVLPPEQYVPYVSSGAVGGSDHGRLVELKTSAKIQLSAVQSQALLYGVLAKGGAQVSLFDLETSSTLYTLEAVGSAKIAALLVNSGSELGSLIAKGVQDLSDEEIAMLILAALDL